MADYDLYGFRSNNLREVARRLEDSFGLTFVPHESLFRGGEYYAYGLPGEEEFILQCNRELDDELAEPSFPEYPILLYVGATERSDTIRQMVAAAMGGEACLLWHKSL